MLLQYSNFSKYNIFHRYKKFKVTFQIWWSEWKRLNWKHDGCYTVDELKKIKHTHKMLKYTWLMHVVILLGMVIELYLKSQADVILNTVLIIVMIALYDTSCEIKHINLLIYLKKKDEEI